MRITFLVVLALCGGFSSAAMAAGIDPVGTVTGALSTIESQTTVASNLTGQTTVVTGQVSSTSGQVSSTSGATGADATNAATSVVSAATSGSGAGGQTSASGGGQTSASGGGQTSTSGDSGTRKRSQSGGTRRSSNDAGARTRFDRLPRRFETLLERIESGHRVRASIARLRSLLATATPRMRHRILRLIRSEIHRLERNGLTRRERVAVRRLHRLLAKLTAKSSPGVARASFPGRFPSGIVSSLADPAGGVASEKAVGRESARERGGPALSIPGVQLPTPQYPSDGFPWLSALLWAFAVAAAAVAIWRTALELATRLPGNRG